jgi:predicted GIY-YIG superfamily endonuclease
MKDWDPEPSLKRWAAEHAKGKEMTYAEAFRVVTLVSDEEWEKQKAASSASVEQATPR